MELSTIYLSIQQEMEVVEAEMAKLARRAPASFTSVLEHVLLYQGKRIRPALTLFSSKLFQPREELLMPMAMAVELFHTATLVHDDIVDSSPVRRGRPTANRLWGQGLALLLGDYLFSQAAELVSATGNLQVIELFAQTLMEVSGGELWQNLSPWEKRQNRQHYYRWIGAKTASVFSLATQSGALLSHAPRDGVEAMKEYGHNLGMAFQIVDDILDVVGEEWELGKPVGWDLPRGSPTLPVILLLEGHPQGRQLKEDLSDPEKIAEASQLLSQSPLAGECIARCYEIARGFAAQAVKALDSSPESPTRRSLLRLVEYAIERRR